MVVVVRSAMIRGPGVDTVLATAATFVETLTMMSIGAVLGALLVPLALVQDWRLVACAVGAAVLVGVPTLPSVFRRLATLTKLHRLHPEIDDALSGVDTRALAPGWAAVAVGWLAMGISLWAALHSIPGVPWPRNLLTDIALMTACAALSTVAGFISGLPGGLGAREWVVMALVQPQYGPVAAVLSAVVHRLVTIVAELVIGALLLATGRVWPRGSMERGPGTEWVRNSSAEVPPAESPDSLTR
jgi:uncharacterized membrane protein YbhN (UPF0104 family)